MTAAEVKNLKESGYHPYEMMRQNENLTNAFLGALSPIYWSFKSQAFTPLTDLLLYQGDRILSNC